MKLIRSFGTTIGGDSTMLPRRAVITIGCFAISMGRMISSTCSGYSFKGAFSVAGGGAVEAAAIEKGAAGEIGRIPDI